MGGFACVINIINWYKLNFTYTCAIVMSHWTTNTLPPLLYRFPVFVSNHFIPGEAIICNLESRTPLRIL